MSVIFLAIEGGLDLVQMLGAVSRALEHKAKILGRGLIDCIGSERLNAGVDRLCGLERQIDRRVTGQRQPRWQYSPR